MESTQMAKEMSQTILAGELDPELAVDYKPPTTEP